MDGASRQTAIRHASTPACNALARGTGPGAIALCPGARQDIRALGYAPNPVTLEGRLREVAQLIALGLADKQIAFHLGVSQGTVKGHVSAILRVLGLYRRTQICRYVHEQSLGLTG